MSEIEHPQAGGSRNGRKRGTKRLKCAKSLEFGGLTRIWLLEWVTRPLSVAQWSAALPDGLVTQVKYQSLLDSVASTALNLLASPTIWMKDKVCLFYIQAGRCSLFSTVDSPSMFPLLSQSSDPSYPSQDAHVLQVIPSWFKSRVTAHLNSIIPRFSCQWNRIPESVLSHPSFQDFKQAVHRHLMSTRILTHDLHYPH